jgi:hypothetical protein
MATVMEKPAPRDMSHHYSRVTKRRIPSQMKRFYKYFAIPGIGNLAGGMLLLPAAWGNLSLTASRSSQPWIFPL